MDGQMDSGAERGIATASSLLLEDKQFNKVAGDFVENGDCKAENGDCKAENGNNHTENGHYTENGDFAQNGHCTENGDFAQNGHYTENDEFSTENCDFFFTENGDFSAENGDLSVENGDFFPTENGDFVPTEKGDFCTENGDVSGGNGAKKDDHTENGTNQTLAAGHSVPFQKVSLQLVEKVCAAMSHNMCVTSPVRSFFQNVHRCRVLDKVRFLDDCLVPRTQCLAADRERAWAKFRTHYLKNLASVRQLTAGSPAIPAWLCMGLFREMLEPSHPEPLSS